MNLFDWIFTILTYLFVVLILIISVIVVVAIVKMCWKADTKNKQKK